MATTLSTGSTYGFTGTGNGVTWAGTLNVSTKVFSGTWDDGAGTGKFTGTVVTPAAGGGAGSAIGSGLYTAVLAQDNADFLALLQTVCATHTPLAGGAVTHSHCTQNSTSPAVNLAYKMWIGGLPHKTNELVVSGPTSVSPGVAKVTSINGTMAGVAVNDACRVDFLEPIIPLVAVQIKSVSYLPSGTTNNFDFRGTANDTISITGTGVVFEYTMTTATSKKIEVHPNLELFNSPAGTEAVMGDIDGSGMWTNYFFCQ